MTAWYENDGFWTQAAPFMFGEARWEGTAEEIDAILELADVESDATVLDLGCGPGRHALELARRGHKVTGVDRTADYLHRARKRADDEGLEIESVRADMRDFRRAQAFDLVLSLYSTFGYFDVSEDNLRVLSNAYDALRAGGKLVIELMGKEILARQFRPQAWREVDGVYLLEERRLMNDWSWLEQRWIVIDGEQRTEHYVGLWLYSAVELRTMLEAAGFEEVAIYGDLAGRPYDQDATRLVAAARK